MAGERFRLFGIIAPEREVNEPMDYDKQNIGDSGETLIYETDDRAEARRLYESGGFAREGVWHAVTRVEDRAKQGTRTLPSKPPAVQPQKGDY